MVNLHCWPDEIILEPVRVLSGQGSLIIFTKFSQLSTVLSNRESGHYELYGFFFNLAKLLYLHDI